MKKRKRGGEEDVEAERKEIEEEEVKAECDDPK